MAYIIQRETLTAIANQIRSLNTNPDLGVTEYYQPRYMATALIGDSFNGTNSFKTNGARISKGFISFRVDQLTEITMPTVTSIDVDAFAGCDNLVSAHFPSCMSVGAYAFEPYSMGNVLALETLTLNSACAISANAFRGVLAPDSKTFRLYLRGNSMGTCSDAVFQVYETEDNANAYVDAHDKYGEPIPGLEIYVPASLLNDFKTTWAGGAFANNIYALTD